MKSKGIYISSSMVLLAAAVVLASCTSSRNMQHGVVENGDMMPSVHRAEVAGGKVPTYRIDVNSEMPVSQKHVEAMPSTRHLASEHEMNRLLNSLFDMAQKGVEVTLTADGRYSESAPRESDLEAVVMSTPVRRVAISWCKRKSREGYAITVKYDAEKQMYTCKAVRPKK
ncbi:MAG: hypothetical protein IKR33_03220 [Bacteroidales bacterium]|nr:hypothetical protein [Bacteroidales bacterium]